MILLITIIGAMLLLGSMAFFLFFYPSQKRTPRGYERQVEGLDEYSRLLELFGLDDNVNEDDIKRAYRQLSKTYHPDTMNAEETKLSVDESAQKFRELDKAYKRLSEIHAKRFKP